MFKIFQLTIKNYQYFLKSISKSNYLSMLASARKPKVFITQPIPDQAFEILDSKGLNLVINKQLPLTREIFLNSVQDCDALYCTLNEKIDTEVLNIANNLKIIGTCSVGFDHIDIKECETRKIKVGYTPGVLTDATAEYAVGLLLNTSRRISEAISAAKNNEWSDWKITWMCGQGLSGSNVGIFGLGRIGLAVAKRLKNFEPNKIIYHNRTKSSEAEKLGFEHVDLNTLFEESDFLIVSCAMTDQTKGFFDLDKFRRMKKNLVFINVSRGGVVNQDDLYIALKENIITAAGLDVTSPEPLASSHQLYKLKNCIISPHICSAETSTRIKMATLTARNIVEAINNRPMIYQITF